MNKTYYTPNHKTVINHQPTNINIRHYHSEHILWIFNQSDCAILPHHWNLT